MSTWNQILGEIIIEQSNGSILNKSDEVINKYLQIFSTKRKRNVIVYYSDFTNSKKNYNLDINDGDMVGFMNACSNLDKSWGLDLIIQTPGGDPTATESIVYYLHSIFGNDIEVFVPHLAMSAGTMLACSSKKIWMGNESSLGPIDPQFNGIPAYNIKKEFEDASSDLSSNPVKFNFWKIRLDKYPPAFYYTVNDAINLSSKLIKEWLTKYMFEGESNSEKISEIVDHLNINTGSHSKHFNKDQCKEFGLKIEDLEMDNDIQDMVLSIYHSFQICGATTNSVKMIQNQNKTAYVSKQI